MILQNDIDDSSAFIAIEEQDDSISDQDKEIVGAEDVDQYKSFVAQHVLSMQMSHTN